MGQGVLVPVQLKKKFMLIQGATFIVFAKCSKGYVYSSKEYPEYIGHFFTGIFIQGGMSILESRVLSFNHYPL